MGFMTQQSGLGFIHADAEKLDRQLREGDGLGWSGDPSLELRIGVLSAPRRMQHPTSGRWINRGDQIAKRYEVWTHSPDGEDLIVGHWRIDEFDRILFDLTLMRAGAQGMAPGVEERIDKKNAAVDKAKSDQFHDAYGEMAEHYLHLWHDRNNPKNTFRGLPGRNPEKQL